MIDHEKKWKIFETVLLILAMFSFLVSSSLWVYYGSALPTSPNFNLGRVIPFSYHGTIVYLTSKEHNVFEILFYGSIVFIIIVIAIDRIIDPFGRNKKKF